MDVSVSISIRHLANSMLSCSTHWGKRYSQLPSDLIKRSPGELSINLKIALLGIQAEDAAQEKAISEAEAEAEAESRRQQR